MIWLFIAAVPVIFSAGFVTGVIFSLTITDRQHHVDLGLRRLSKVAPMRDDNECLVRDPFDPAGR